MCKVETKVEKIWSIPDVSQLQGLCQMSGLPVLFWIRIGAQQCAKLLLNCRFPHQLLRDDLQLQKKAPKFMPHVLTEEQKELRVRLC